MEQSSKTVDNGVEIAELHVCSCCGSCLTAHPFSLNVDTLRNNLRIRPTQHHTHKWTVSARHTIVLITSGVILNSGAVGHPHKT